MEKLEKLQSNLKEWQGSIKKGRERIKKKLTRELEMLLEEEKNDDTMEKIIDIKVHLNMEIDRDEIYWEQRARVNWLKVGDKNSTFFHKYALLNTISKLELDGGGKATEESMIKEVATLFFQKVFTSKGIGDLSHLLTGIKGRISPDINAELMSKFIEEEVYSALKEMGPTKTPGSDGFSVLFFQRSWHIIGKEVINFCMGILHNGKNLGTLNSTDIVLIPKTQNPTNLVNFKPISLCTVLYKIVAKTITNRLKEVIGRCIDAAQSAFIPRRLISNNVLLAYEILHTF